MRMFGRLGRPPPEVDAPASRSGYGMLLRPMILPPISPRFLRTRLRYPGRLAFLWALLMYRQRIAWEDCWTLRERLEQDEVDSDLDDDKLAAQLGCIKWGSLPVDGSRSNRRTIWASEACHHLITQPSGISSPSKNSAIRRLSNN